jgi:hypothetical protein
MIRVLTSLTTFADSARLRGGYAELLGHFADFRAIVEHGGGFHLERIFQMRFVQMASPKTPVCIFTSNGLASSP